MNIKTSASTPRRGTAIRIVETINVKRFTCLRRLLVFEVQAIKMAAGSRVAQMGVSGPALQKVVDPKYFAKVTFIGVLIKWWRIWVFGGMV
jgi:hypothetical protein